MRRDPGPENWIAAGAAPLLGVELAVIPSIIVFFGPPRSRGAQIRPLIAAPELFALQLALAHTGSSQI